MALIPPFFFDCVAAIGERDSEGNVAFTATGFLFGKLLTAGDQPQNNIYRVYLITNRHVFEEKNSLVLRFNTTAGTPAKTFDMVLKDQDGSVHYFLHPDPDVDVAAIFINASLLQQQGIQFLVFTSDQHILSLQQASTVGVMEGNGLFLLGFPMGDVGTDQNFVVARQGTIARIRDAISGVAKYFLADAFIFPGNSGGPVVTRPEVVSITGTASHAKADLIGIVAGYLPYQDIAISIQTKKPRVIFEENSGLAVIFSVDQILAVVNLAESILFPTPLSSDPPKAA